MDRTVSIATGNFIKAVYKHQRMDNLDSRPGSIAKELNITHAAATDMARKLTSKELVAYEKYKELKLTPSGERVALDIIRKHRLWETFLHNVLGLSMHEIHQEAELLEHLTTDFLAEKISSYLGNPKTDPHGDPIPDIQGRMETGQDWLPLSAAKADKDYEIIRLSGSGKEFFDFCVSNNLKVGTVAAVKKQYPKSGLTEIIANRTTLLLDEKLTSQMFVRKTK